MGLRVGLEWVWRRVLEWGWSRFSGRFYGGSGMSFVGFEWVLRGF